MSYLFDSDWLVDMLRGVQHSIELANELHERGVSTSIITVGEIYDGAFNSVDPQQRLAYYRTFFAGFSIINLTDDVMETFARERAALRRQGQPIADMDLLIAATAITHDLTLVTRNTRHFRRIPSLKLYQST